MADSENSRTLPSNRYRNLLAATGRRLSDLATSNSAAKDGEASEPLAKWAAWSLAYHECARLCDVQQRLERELFRTEAKSTGPNSANPPRSRGLASTETVAMSLDQEASRNAPLSATPALASRVGQPQMSEKAAAHRRARAAEDAASVREQDLAAELWSISEGSTVSALAKLHCLLEQGEPVPQSAEFPWPQIRSALADLLIASGSSSRTTSEFAEAPSNS